MKYKITILDENGEELVSYVKETDFPYDDAEEVMIDWDGSDYEVELQL